MLEAIIWGFVQGVTEFLPISSDGHLVLVPAFLGFDPPDLATTAVLHLGTRKHHERYLKRVASLELLGCFAMSEGAHGPNVQRVRTTGA